MYLNVRGEKVSRARYREMLEAAKTRRELIAAGLTSRRDLLKMGLLTAGGMLVAKSGLSARASAYTQDATGGSNNLCVPSQQAASPPTRAFVDPLPIMPIATPVRSLNPAPTEAPNTAAGESRTRNHQMFNRFIQNALFYNVTQRQIQVRQSPDLPMQNIWAFDDGVHATSPGPTYVNAYGLPILVRNHNALPPVSQNGGFGLPSVTTHLHNGHTPSESDGFPCDFFEIGHFYDQQYPNVLAGFASDHQPNGDINESLSTLWYHDHRVDFTSQNTYKGLLGFFLLFNQFDTGFDDFGFRLPDFPAHDIPLLFADKVYDPNTGALAFDLFNLDGILGDKFLVNGKIQPFFVVQPRRYRFRLLDTGPSRFYEFFLTGNLNPDGTARSTSPTTNNFFVIANDGNLLPTPVQVQSVRIGVAERVDIIIDFKNFAGKSLFLENRLNQINGQGPVITSECGVPEILNAGQGNMLLRFDVNTDNVSDDSVDPATGPHFYSLPDTTATPRITRTFKFDRLNGQWSINGQFMDCNEIRVHIQPNSVEHWLLTNATGDWTHPIHIHEEEHQILTRNRQPVTLAVEHSRKDVTQLHPNERVQLFFRFRDWTGRYPLHCHNVIHEDHAMMLRWEIDPNGGDQTLVP
jgi:FtsP/CotA-like multicopper oxidase with cupredoxin domain